MASPDEAKAMQARLVQAFARNKVLPNRGEAVEEFLHRQTHAHLQHQELSGELSDSVPDLVPKASVVYLYGNRLVDVCALSRMSAIQMLYLQDNQLTSTAQLASLTALQKLVLDGNCIAHVSGLHNMRCLNVLHLSRQRLSDGRGVTFDAASLRGLASNLATLRAASCGIRRISDLGILDALQSADFSRNKLEDTADCLAFINGSSVVHELDLRGNPVCVIPKFLDQVIAAGNSIQCLNGSDVKAETRTYLQQLVKRGVRAPSIPATRKCSDSDGTWTAERASVGGRSQSGPMSASSGSRLSSKGSRRLDQLGGTEPGTDVEGLSMECVGVALCGSVACKEVSEDLVCRRREDSLQQPGDSLAAGTSQSGLLASGGGLRGRPGMLAEVSGQHYVGKTPVRQKKAVFRP